ncbi:MAG: DinB family protein [Planctomycetota bacterium]
MTTSQSCCQETSGQAASSECCGGAAKAASGTCCKTAVAAHIIPRLGKVDSLEKITALPNAELVMRFRKGVENFDRRLFWLTEEQLDQAFLPDAGVGRWPARVLIGHVADADLVAIHRMRKIVAEERPLLTEWDENAFVDQNLYGVGQGASGGGSIGAFVAIIHTLRQWAAMWLAGLSDAQLARTGMHPTKGEQSVRTIVASYTYHLEYHAAFLNAKIVKFLGEAAEASEAPAAGGCGCKH